MTDVLSPPRMSARDFDAIRDLLVARSGIELRDGKEPLVAGRLDRRLRALGLQRYEDYLALLDGPGGDEETTLLVDLLTTNETYFFREPRHFELLPDLLEDAGADDPERPLRVWSAACSTGEEACTVALTLADRFAQRPWEVVGTDISSRVVATARRGLYPVEAAARIPERALKAHCLRGRGEYEGLMALTPALRERLRFRRLNLLDPLPADLGRFDAVLLRNVMIYFSPETKTGLLRAVTEVVRPGGYLLVGHAESLTGLASGLEPVAPAVYRVPRG